MSPARVSLDSSTSQPPGLRISRRTPRDRVGLAGTDDGLVRLVESDLGLERLALLGRDVGRVRDDEVEGPSQARDEVAEHELHAILERGARAVLRRESERVRRDVGRHDPRAVVLVGDRERDRARAGADVEDERLRRRPRDVVECALDDGLGLRAGYEHSRVDAQRQPPEAPLAEDVGGRLARGAPLDERREACLGLAVSSPSGAA